MNMIIQRLLNKIKLSYKRNMFLNISTCGKNLGLSAGSYCTAKSKEQIRIGDNCDLPDCRLYAVGDGSIEIGNFTTIRYNSKLSAVSKIKIGNYVIISNNVRIYDHNSHPTDPQTRVEMCRGGFYGEAWSPVKSDNKPVIIDDNVWIGEYSTILKGVHIGQGSIVASNSVVVKDVPPYSIVAGNPAKVVKRLEGHLNEKINES